jgi:hypothetical protein
MADEVGSRIDKLLGKDFSQMSSEEILNIISGGQNFSIPYEDLQSKEGFAKELDKSQKEAQSIINSLKPKGPPIPMKKIEDLACKYEGDDLYSRILLESIKNEDIELYNSLINSPEYKNNIPVTEEDLGIKINVGESIKSDNDPNINPKTRDLGFSGKIPSEGITRYIRKKNPEVLEKINEKIFDNIDPLTLGKPSNSGSRKKRKMNVLGFNIPLEFIMNGTQIAHVKIGGDELSIDGALKKINSLLKDQNKNLKPCQEFDNEDDINPPSLAERIDEFDANFFPDGDDPIVDDDCLPGVPEDPITGDPILTKSSFDEGADDFCDPPDYKFEPSEEVPDPEPPSVDVSAIDACISSALDKSKKLEDDIKILARWQNIERSLEEILYHYEGIYEYQKSLYNNWIARAPKSEGADPSDLGLGLQILTYNDQINEYNKDLIDLAKKYDSDRSIFLENVEVFTDNLFLLNLSDLDLDDNKLKELFDNQIKANKSPIIYDEEKKTWPISEGIIQFRNNIEDIRTIIKGRGFIGEVENKIKETKDLLSAAISTLEQRKGKRLSISDVEKIFIPNNTTNFDPYGQGNSSLEINERVFKSPAQNLFSTSTYAYDSYGYDFLEELKKFSVRYKTKFIKSRGELQFELSFMSDYGSPLPYHKVKKPSKISFSGSTSEPLKEVNEPDEKKIKIGNEYAGNGGLLNGSTPEYLKSYQYIKINNIKTGTADVAKFYDFIERIIKTGDSKQSIITRIVEERGILYGQLIEKSASNWLFFNSSERGDNDSRDPSKNRPSSFTQDGEPNPVFIDFYSNFKPKWNNKYRENKTRYIDPAIKSIREKAIKAGEGLGKTLPVSDIIGIRIYENYLDVKKKYEQIKEVMLIASSKIEELNDSVSPENVKRRFEDLKCAGADNGDSGAGFGGSGEGVENSDPENCPPKCCGKPGSDFDTKNYLTSSPPSSDCPTIFQRCWWKQFCKDVTKVGLLPYPNGLPPIEDPKYFLAAGPAVRLGLKYWPVGYLPPAFIPIPFPNPIDGQPYIRIPLPMIWTIVPPILIPLPFNLGILVIFIPFIGGFMPTPLVYIKEFLTGSSFFLTGLRGPRFIPRKSDPVIKDPFEKIKQALSFGIPDKLIPFPGFGLDNLDSKERVLGDIKANLSKIFDNVPPPGNMQAIRDLQNKERELKKIIRDKEREYKNKAALLDLPKPNIEEEKIQLENIINQRKDALKSTVRSYLENSIPEPKSIYFPKDKDKLKIDIPGIVRSLRILKEMKASLVPIDCPDFINFKDEMREVLKLMKIICPPIYFLENFEVANSSKIFLRINKDPRLMTDDEFRDLVRGIRGTSLLITKVILWGNKFSVIKKVRSGAFSLVESSEYQGIFKFPEVKITNYAPRVLRFLRKRNPIIEAMKIRIMDGLSKIEYRREDFSRYVRYDGENPILVIRVKDLKKLVSKKLGLSRIGPFDPVRPLDEEDPLISRFPYPKGPLSCLGSLNGGFGNAVALFEMPTVFPPKQDQIAQIPGLGGIIQVKISGSRIKSFLIDALLRSLDAGALELAFPEINDINSPRFLNLDPLDVQKLSKNLTLDLINPSSPNLPEFLNVLNIPIIPPARPTDMIEQALIGLGAPPPARIVYSLFWEYYKSLPKTPLGEKLVFPKVSASAELLAKIPWPLAVLIGRNLLNILNPIAMSDDHPVWRRMSLKNTYYVVYIDEFLRSAADVSGLFKFFLGSSDPIYPIPELPTELKKAFNIKKY